MNKVGRIGKGRRIQCYSNITIQLFRKKDVMAQGAPPPSPFLNEASKPTKLYSILFFLFFNILISLVFIRFLQLISHFIKFEEISNSYSLSKLYIIEKLTVWQKRIYNLFCAVFKSRENIGENISHEILQSPLKIA